MQPMNNSTILSLLTYLATAAVFVMWSSWVIFLFGPFDAVTSLKYGILLYCLVDAVAFYLYWAKKAVS